MDQTKTVSPYSIRGIARGIGNAYDSAVGATSNAIEAVARPFSTPPGYTPAVAQAPATPAPAPMQPPPTVSGAIGAIRAHQQELANLADGGMVGRDGEKKRRGFGARRAMPLRGSDAPRLPGQAAPGYADGGKIGPVEHGGFHRWLGKPEDEPITAQDIAKGLASSDPHVRKMANFARNSRSWDHSGGHMMAHGGKVHGPGTGTSDSIPVNLSKGEYVMPADSTARIGVRKLDAMRHATHKFVDTDRDRERGRDTDRDGMKNGGRVADRDHDRDSRRDNDRDGMADGGMACRLGARRKMANGGLVVDKDPMNQIPLETRTAPAGQRVADDPIASSEIGRNVMNTLQALTPVGGGVASRGVAMLARGAGAAAASPAVAAVAPFVPVAGGATALQVAASPPTPATQTAAPAAPAAALTAPPMQSQPVSRPQTPGAPAAEAAMGSGSAVDAPVAPTEGAVASSAGTDAMSRTNRASEIYRSFPGAGQNTLPAGVGALVMPDRQAERNAQFDEEVLRDRAARIGGRGGAALLRSADNMMTARLGAQRNAGQQQNQVDTLLANDRQNEQRNQLDARRVAATEAEAGARIGVANQQLSDAQRITRLQAKLASTADPKQREQLRQQILLAQSRASDNPARFTVVPGGQSVDPATGQIVREPSQVLDNQTGRFIQTSATPAVAAAPAGAVAMLRSNPALAAQFDQKYGAGSAARILGTTK